MAAVKCLVVTPERTVLDQFAESVVLPMYDGELGVLVNRAPLIGRLAPGELRLRRGDNVKRFYVDGGFAQVKDNVVTVLTPKAIPAEDLKPDAVQSAMKEALKSAATAEAQEAQNKAQQRARAQMRILQKTAESDHGGH